MKTETLILVLLLAIVALPIGGSMTLLHFLRPPDVTIHANVIPRNRDHYSSAILADDPAQNAYCYNLATYISIPDIKTSAINVANELGQIPVFRFHDAVFIVLHKGRNYSRGLVLLDDASEMANEYRTIKFQKLEPGLYYWEQDGQRILREPDLYERDVVTPINGGYQPDARNDYQPGFRVQIEAMISVPAC